MGDVIRLRRSNLEWRMVEGEVVALDLEGSVYLTVNKSGVQLWPAVVEGATREQLVQTLESTYGLDRDSAARDVDAFVEQLRDKGLLEDDGEPANP
jgi:hypothetical protein